MKNIRCFVRKNNCIKDSKIKFKFLVIFMQANRKYDKFSLEHFLYLLRNFRKFLKVVVKKKTVTNCEYLLLTIMSVKNFLYVGTESRRA